MSFAPSDTLYFEFSTHNPSTGAAVDADSLPTALLLRNGGGSGATVTVTKQATGVYGAEAAIDSDWVAGDVLQFRVSAAVNGISANTQSDIRRLGGAATSAVNYTLDGTVYCSRSDVEDVFGPDNVKKWADLNNNGDETEISDRITRAITVVTNTFNDFWRGGPYELPITESGAAASIVHHAACLAGVLLYEWRGIEDFDEETGKPVHKLAYFRKEAEKFMQAVKTGRLRLDATTGRRSAASPFITE